MARLTREPRRLGPPPAVVLAERRTDPQLERMLSAILERSRPAPARGVLLSPEGDRIVIGQLDEMAMVAIDWPDGRTPWSEAIERAAWRAHYAHERRGDEWVDLGGEG